MEVFGWIMLILLALFGAFMLGLMVGPFVIAKIKSFNYKTKTFIEDEKIDTDKRSDQRRHRQELKRQRDFELMDKKLDVKLNKVDKKIKVQEDKLKLVQNLEKQLSEESRTLKSKKHEYMYKPQETEGFQERERHKERELPKEKTEHNKPRQVEIKSIPPKEEPKKEETIISTEEPIVSVEEPVVLVEESIVQQENIKETKQEENKDEI